MSSTESLAYYDPDSLLLRTVQKSLIPGYLEFCETLPRAGTMRNGNVYGHPILFCRTVANEHLLLPTPTKSLGAKGWGISVTGRGRYSQSVIDNAMRYTYKPPPTLIEWLMGFPVGHTDLESKDLETPSSQQSRNGSGDA